MVLQQNSMMRMMQQLADAFFRILAGRTIDSPVEVQTEIEDLVGEVLGTQPAFVLGQGAAAIDTVEPGIAAQVGRLLLLHATLSDELDEPERARRARTMAFHCLSRALERPDANFAEIATTQLREHLNSLSLVVDPSDLSAACLAAHRAAELRGDWDDAEDWLFWALDAKTTEATIETGRTFYARLASLGDDELRAGGLTRAEVKESQRELDHLAP